jgi:NAD(P)-dependent dehydrogenase (short-subunit alcohol dehydrogenase family)
MRRNKHLHWRRVDYMRLDLTGKRVAIVGGTGGIGRAFSRFMASRGAHVWAVGQTFRDEGTPRIEFIKADLSLMRESIVSARSSPLSPSLSQPMSQRTLTQHVASNRPQSSLAARLLFSGTAAVRHTTAEVPACSAQRYRRRVISESNLERPFRRLASAAAMTGASAAEQCVARSADVLLSLASGERTSSSPA